ncbi:MAG: hypothetical protein ACLQPH_10835 [Acidimicrobiales bacterium]
MAARPRRPTGNQCPECRLRPTSYKVITPTGKQFRRCYYCKSGFENFVPGCTYKRL